MPSISGAFCFNTRCLPVTADGKLEEVKPTLLSKLLSSGSASEPGHSSSSEGEKEFAAPEWDVPLSKNSLRE